MAAARTATIWPFTAVPGERASHPSTGAREARPRPGSRGLL